MGNDRQLLGMETQQAERQVGAAGQGDRFQVRLGWLASQRCILDSRGGTDLQDPSNAANGICRPTPKLVSEVIVSWHVPL